MAVTYRMGANPVDNAKTTFLVLSDTHAFPFETPENAFGIPCPKVDVALHCGDLTQAGGIGEYKRNLKMLSALETELKLVIAGNHDVSLDSRWCQKPEDEEDYKEAVALMNGPAAVNAVASCLASTRPLTRPNFGDYAFMYDFNEDRFNSAEQVAMGKTTIAERPIQDGIDIVMTHGPPHMHHYECSTGNTGCDMLMRALERTKPKMHCFGYIHEGAGTSTLKWEDGRETLLVNAAIMGVQGDPTDKPTNMLIIVELDLPKDNNL